MLPTTTAALLATILANQPTTVAPPKRAGEAPTAGARISGRPATGRTDAAPARRGVATPPNILVVVLDDLGIDQMSFPPFGWNAAPEAPAMPVLAEIASQGVSFRNF